MGGCAADGGCPSDYVAISISAVCLFLYVYLKQFFLLLVRFLSGLIFDSDFIDRISCFWVIEIATAPLYLFLMNILMWVGNFWTKLGYFLCYIYRFS